MSEPYEGHVIINCANFPDDLALMWRRSRLPRENKLRRRGTVLTYGGRSERLCILACARLAV